MPQTVFCAEDVDRSFLFKAILGGKDLIIAIFSYTIIYIGAFSCIYLDQEHQFTFHNVLKSENYLLSKLN